MVSAREEAVIMFEENDFSAAHTAVTVDTDDVTIVHVAYSVLGLSSGTISGQTGAALQIAADEIFEIASAGYAQILADKLRASLKWFERLRGLLLAYPNDASLEASFKAEWTTLRALITEVNAEIARLRSYSR